MKFLLFLALSSSLLFAAEPPDSNAVMPSEVVRVPVYTEGIVFDRAGNGYISSGKVIYRVRFDVDGRSATEVWAEPGGPNGHKICGDGTHLVCDNSHKAVLHLDADGKLLDKASTACDGKPLRSPNDLCLDAHGGVYFTDPGGAKRGEFVGNVHYIDAAGKTQLSASQLAFPNGIVLRPDGKSLLVNDTFDNCVYAFEVLSPGKLGEKKLLAALPEKVGEQFENMPDGMCLDEAGNLYVAHYGMRQVQVINPDGKVIRRYAAGNLTASNVAFSGPRMDQLFITGALGKYGESEGALFALDLKGVRGLPLFASTRAEQTASPEPQWIWFPEGEPATSAPTEPRYFRKTLTLKHLQESAEFEVAADTGFELFINGEKVGGGSDAKSISKFELSGQFVVGENVIAVKGLHEKAGPAGLMVAALLRDRSSPSQWVVTDASWKSSKDESAGWNKPGFDDSKWQLARALGAFGKTAPWDKLGAATLAGRRFEAPPGFVVERVADAALTGSIVRFQFDHLGRPMISREGGATLFTKKLTPGQGDTFILDGKTADGRYTKAWVYSDKVKDCQGYFDLHGTLYCVGVGPDGPGVYKQTGPEGGPADHVELLHKTQGEFEYHGPHQILYGPDGHLYFNVANRAAAAPYAQNSPYQNGYEGQLLSSWPDPRSGGNSRTAKAPGGTILRSTDMTGKAWTLEVAGFRNHYGFAFDRLGEIWTFDSDHEPDLDLPWYRPNRINHCPRGAEFGWRNGTGNWPDYYADSLPAVANVGRGCPTGVVFYHHRAFPEKYSNAFFMGDWSLGRIVVVYTKFNDASFTATFEDFVIGRPMTVTDMDIGPDGCLYFSTGGANTEGGLYRVRYVGEQKNELPLRGLERALHQPQLESAWAQTEVALVKKEMGAKWDAELLEIVKQTRHDTPERARALVLMQQFGPSISEELALKLASDPLWRIRADAVRLLGDFDTPRSSAALIVALKDAEALVRRRSLEGILRLRAPVQPSHLMPLAADADRTIRFLAHAALKRAEPALLRQAVFSEGNPRAAAFGMMALAAGVRDRADVEPLLKKQRELLHAELSADVLVELSRAIALTLISNDESWNVFHQEARNTAPLSNVASELGTELLKLFPHADWRVNREIARVCARLQTPGLQARLLEQLSKGASREQQVHYAYCLRAVKEGWTEAERTQMLAWFCSVQDWSGGTSVSSYVDTIFDAWLKTVPLEQADAFRKERLARKPKERELLPLKPAQSKYGFDQLVSYLDSHPGDAKRGTAVLQKARCLACHRFGNAGEMAAPDLSTVSKRFQRKEIVESIVYPSKVIADQFKGVGYALVDGRAISGMPLSETEKSVTVMLSDTSKVTISKADIKKTVVMKQSNMPEGLLNEFTLEEISDLFALLEGGPAK